MWGLTPPLWGLTPPPYPRESTGCFTPKSPNGENCQYNLLKLTTAPAPLLPIVLMTYLGL